MQADFVLDYDVLTVQQPHKLYLIARLTAGSSPDDHQRRPLNLSLVIDHSGSMAGDKLDYTRQAAQFLVQNLSTRDILSIVLYNNRVETLVAQPLYCTRMLSTSASMKSKPAARPISAAAGWKASITSRTTRAAIISIASS